MVVTLDCAVCNLLDPYKFANDIPAFINHKLTIILVLFSLTETFGHVPYSYEG